jgi:hypothetical protein
VYSNATFLGGNTTELELTPDGSVLYWGSGNLLNALPTNGSTGDQKDTNFPVYGVEYFNGKFCCSTSNGIYETSLSNGIFSLLALKSSIVAQSELEVGANNKLYAVSAGKLVAFDVNFALETTNITVNSNGIFPFLATLEDQIDGEDYSNFNGITVARITALAVNGTDVMNANVANPVVAYNCNAINLSSTVSTGSYYTLKIYNHTDQGGNYTSSGVLAYSNTTNASLPASLDLRSLSGSNGNYLANNNGYFKVSVSITDNCTTSEKELFLHIPFNPNAATVTVMLNQQNGTPVVVSQSLPGQSVGMFSGSYNIGLSQGDIEFHTVKIDQVDPGTGAVINPLLPTFQTNVSGSVSNVTALSLNGLNIPANAALNWSGGIGFFFQNNSNTYRIKVGVGNVCNTSTDWSYITPNGFYRTAADLAFDETLQKSVYPNPFRGNTTVVIPLEDYEELSSFDMVDARGLVQTVPYEVSINNNQVSIAVEGEILENGIYLYRCTTNQGLHQGRLVKQ